MCVPFSMPVRACTLTVLTQVLPPKLIGLGIRLMPRHIPRYQDSLACSRTKKGWRMELRTLDLSVHCCQQPVKLCRHVDWPTVRVLNKAQLTFIAKILKNFTRTNFFVFVLLVLCCFAKSSTQRNYYFKKSWIKEIRMFLEKWKWARGLCMRAENFKFRDFTSRAWLVPSLSLPYSTNEENTKKEIIFGLETFFW